MEEILRQFPNLTPTQIEQFERLYDLYQDWNSKINVISRKDIDELYTKHVLHSLSIAKVMEFLPEADVLDVGTGGGFPAIPLAIMFPETNFYAIDVIAEKVTYLSSNKSKLEKEIEEELKAIEDLLPSALLSEYR